MKNGNSEVFALEVRVNHYAMKRWKTLSNRHLYLEVGERPLLFGSLKSAFVLLEVL